MKKLVLATLTLIAVLSPSITLISPTYALTESIFNETQAQNAAPELEQILLSDELHVTTAAEATYTLSEVSSRNTRTNCWTIVNEVVYDITSYISSHPGGQSSISKICGKDGTSIFGNIHGGSATQANILATYKIGLLQKTATKTCPSGSFYNLSLNACAQAPKGYYVTAANSAAGVTSATACPVGKYSATFGSTQCISATPGFFVDIPASTAAKPCPKGYFSSAPASMSCQAAQNGFYVATPGSSMASKCPSGKTTATTGSTTSSACYKPIVQTIPGFKPPKTMKYGTVTNLPITTNAKALANFRVSGPCTAKVISIVTKVIAKHVTTKVLKLTAGKKAGNCLLTLTSVAKERYLFLSKQVIMKISGI